MQRIEPVGLDSGALGKPRVFQPFEGFRDRFVIRRKDGREESVESPELVYLPGGTFQRGDEQGYPNERQVHSVRVAAFALGRTPVSWGDYRQFCRATGTHWPEWLEPGSEYHVETGKNDYYASRGITPAALDLPVVGIAWDDARAYCDWLSEHTGERYTLPTESQWEYACRAGSRTRWCFGDNAAGLADPSVTIQTASWPGLDGFRFALPILRHVLDLRSGRSWASGIETLGAVLGT